MRRLLLIAFALGCAPAIPPGSIELRVATTAPIATVDPRFLSVAIDTSQFLGGTWWSSDSQAATGTAENAVAPFDFTRPALVPLARALAPAYLRIGGTQADDAWYDLSDTPAATAPAPFTLVLNHREWDAMQAFSTAAGFDVFFTLNAGPGPRNAQGAWTPDNARSLLDYATTHHQPVAAWELGNEVNAYLVTFGSAGTVSATQYADDLGAARSLIAEASPGARLAGPASAFWPMVGELPPFLPKLLPLGGSLLDIVTWHYYPQQSTRCPIALTPATQYLLLQSDALAEIDTWATGVEQLASAYAPSAQVWLGETGNAQCGGAPGISNRFVATLWWLDELGRMSSHGEQVAVRQTLSGSDYGLLDDATLTPNPDYWTSVLFKRLVGTRVLAVDMAPDTLPSYAWCARSGPPGAITLATVNLSQSQAVTVAVTGVPASGALGYALTADDPLGTAVKLNGKTLEAGTDGTLPPLNGSAMTENGDAAWLRMPPISAAFVVLPNARAKACE
jgi:hypothetical protein